MVKLKHEQSISRVLACFETFTAAVRAFDKYPCYETEATREAAGHALLKASGDEVPNDSLRPPRLPSWSRP